MCRATRPCTLVLICGADEAHMVRGGRLQVAGKCGWLMIRWAGVLNKGRCDGPCPREEKAGGGDEEKKERSRRSAVTHLPQKGRRRQ